MAGGHSSSSRLRDIQYIKIP